MKKIKETGKNKALLIDRICAFVLDILIVSAIASLISYPFLDGESINKLNEEASELRSDYQNKKIDDKTFVSESSLLSYQLAKKNGMFSIILIITSILYFIVYQFYNCGQTIGKKLLKIRVVNKDVDKELTMNNVVIRSLLINSILIDMISLAFVIFSKQSVYFYSVGFFQFFQSIIMISSFIMVGFGKGRGIHDLLAHTEVIKTSGVKELETCAS